jgi:hypothetical protein
VNETRPDPDRSRGAPPERLLPRSVEKGNAIEKYCLEEETE